MFFLISLDNDRKDFGVCVLGFQFLLDVSALFINYSKCSPLNCNASCAIKFPLSSIAP